MQERAVIVGVARTPQGKIQGQLSEFSAVQLGTYAAREAIKRSKVAESDFEFCIIGNVLQAGSGQNPARQIAIHSGLPWSTISITINKLCLSGSTAVIDAARLIQTGEARVVLAGGTESMSNAPHLLKGSRSGHLYGDIVMQDHTAIDGLTDAFDDESMGSCTQRHTDEKKLGRREMDEFAASSHQRAAKALLSEVFKDEIVEIIKVDRKGKEHHINTDEGIRPESTVDSLGQLRPAFAKDGSITAGNASPISDGASALVVVSESYAKEKGLAPLAVILGYGTVAGPDNSLLSQPARAIKLALQRSDTNVDELAQIEINEAFASVALQSTAELGASPERVNPNGGAIAIGHPLGASGARLAAHAALFVSKSGKKAALGLCGGGGQGDGMVLGPI